MSLISFLLQLLAAGLLTIALISGSASNLTMSTDAQLDAAEYRVTEREVEEEQQRERAQEEREKQEKLEEEQRAQKEEQRAWEEEQRVLNETTTPFGGKNFTFGCDGNAVRLPCSYSDFLKYSGLERRDVDTAPGPDPDDKLRSSDYEDFMFLYVPGTDEYASVSIHAASYVLDENGGKVFLQRNGEQVFEAETYGECEVYQVFANYFSWDDIDDFTRFTFACGVTFGMSREEVHERLGEPYKYVQNSSVDYEVYLDGAQVMTVGYFKNEVDTIEMDYDQVFASRQ